MIPPWSRPEVIHADTWYFCGVLLAGLVGGTVTAACHVTPLPVPNAQDWQPAGPVPDGWAGDARDAGRD